METPDKNAHLSPLLSNIKDYGPVDEAPAGDPVGTEEASRQRVQADEPDQLAEQEPPPARAGRGARWTIYSLVALWLLTLGSGFAAFVWQQTRIDRMVSERESERREAQRSIAAAEREAASLSNRVQVLEAEVAGLPTDLAADLPRTTSTGIAEAQTPPTAASTIPEAGSAGEGETPHGDAGQRAESEALQTADSQIGADAGHARPEASAQGDSDPAAEGDAEQTAVGSLSSVPVEPVAGGWFVNLSTFSTEALAREWLAKLPGPPADASVIPVQSSGRKLYRVRIGGFGSRREARAAADRITTDWEIEGTWISEN